MKTKTYPEIGFLRLRDVIGDNEEPGDHSGESFVPGRRSVLSASAGDILCPLPAKSFHSAMPSPKVPLF